MKKQITIDVYSYDELSKEAKERALKDFRDEEYDDAMLPSHLCNLIKEELEEKGIEYDTDSITPLYSLSYSQGDGLMFEGVMTYEGHSVVVKHRGHYYYSKTAEFTYRNEEDEDTLTDKQRDQFEELYHSICKTIEQRGYDEIEYTRSEEYFENMCDANNYLFKINGKQFIES